MGSGFSTSAFTALNASVFAPMPSASDRIETMANAGLRASVRNAYDKSPRRSSSQEMSVARAMLSQDGQDDGGVPVAHRRDTTDYHGTHGNGRESTGRAEQTLDAGGPRRRARVPGGRRRANEPSAIP